MTSTPPDHYRHTGETVMSNFDGSIDPSGEDRLKSEEVVMDYAAWHFHGLVWYCRERMKFCCEVSRHGRSIETIVADTLEEVMEIASDTYGRE